MQMEFELQMKALEIALEAKKAELQDDIDDLENPT